MRATVLNKPKVKTKTIDWVNPHSEYIVTLEEYRKEMQAAENSGFISFEDHKKNMNEWLTTNYNLSL
jgi:3-oxoacyl-[acyl-carrier-protein] synthase III